MLVLQKTRPLFRMHLAHGDKLIARINHRIGRDTKQRCTLVDRFRFGADVDGGWRFDFGQTFEQLRSMFTWKNIYKPGVSK